MIPYTSIDMLHAMQREWFEDDRRLDSPDAAAGPPPTDREHRPDPLGLAFAKLLSGDAFRAGAHRMVRLGRIAPRRAA